MSKKIDKIVKSFIKEINSFINIKYAYVFGSYVNGRYLKDSDIDIAIFSPDINRKNKINYLKKILMKISKYKTDIQPILFNLEDYNSPDNQLIKKEIKQKGRIIFKR